VIGDFTDEQSEIVSLAIEPSEIGGQTSVRSEVEDYTDEPNKDRDLSSFQGTVFDAALSAGNGEIWLAESVGGSMEPRFITQRRHLDRIFRIFGIHPSLKPLQRELISDLLQIPGQIIHDSLSALKAEVSIEQQGKIVLHLLTFLFAIPFPYQQLTKAGAVAELWPHPCFWDAEKKVYGTFRPLGNRGSPKSKT